MKRKRRRLEANGVDVDADDNSQMSDMPVTVLETATGRLLKGDEAPLMSQISSWLESHPGWEVIDETDDSDESDEEREPQDADIGKGNCRYRSICPSSARN